MREEKGLRKVCGFVGERFVGSNYFILSITNDSTLLSQNNSIRFFIFLE